MGKIKLLVGLTAMVSALAFSVASAFADYESVGSTGSGSVELKGLAKFTGSGITAECTGLTGGTYQIQEAGANAKKGKVENLAGQFTKCQVTIAGITKAATVNSTCELNITATSTTTATGGVTKECIVKNGKCEIKVSKVNNSGLGSVTTGNVGSNNEIKSNVVGITNTVANCPAGVENSTKASFTAVATALEQKNV